MKTVILTLLICTSGFAGRSQSFVQLYSDLADSCRLDSITSYLQQFEAFGVKSFNSTELQDTRDWIIQQYTQWGYTDIVQDNFNVGGNFTLTNIVITKTGTHFPNTFVIIDGHYDTVNGPGANDNGTGTSIIMELARILKDVPTKYSIKFIHFSGEEIGLNGSTHYVDNVVVPGNMDIKVVLNIDEVGGIEGMTNDKIVCERDESQPNSNNAQSAVMTNELATCMGLYSNLQTEISFAYASDYVPFMNNGYVVTGLYEKNESPYPHTSQDLLMYVDIPYVYQVTKGSMGALAHFAIAYSTADVEQIELDAFLIYPNPTSDKLTIDPKDKTIASVNVEMYDLTGARVVDTELTPANGESTLDISHLESGSYLLKLVTERGISTRQIVKY